ncbi:MAG TPA: carboxypeptidase-like regulatory domain-containing protein, partial [Blastocatellia bacterium]|nr:carboxypeptidase-like regulatory domain-containing protein [Blastocatellia bacterium]
MHRIHLPAVRKAVAYLLVAMLLSISTAGAANARSGFNVSGVVLDSSGAALADATVSLLSAQQVTVGTAKTDPQGRFTFNDVPSGSYQLVVASLGFAEQQQMVSVGQAAVENIEVKLNPGAVKEEVTVTANPGMVESTGTITQQVNVIGEQQISERAKGV